MPANLYSIIGALGPVFILILIGHLFARFRFPEESFWPQAERLTYFVLFPTLLIQKIGTASLPAMDTSIAIIVLLVLMTASSFIILLLGHLVEPDKPRQTSIFQGGVRFNTYVGLAAASALFGDTGLVWGAVFMATMIPTINVACISCFAFLVPNKQLSLGRNLWQGIVKNPLIIACIIGAILNISGIGVPQAVIPTMNLLSSMALPLGLLAVGVGLNLSGIRHSSYAIWLSVVFKLIFYPLLFIVIANVFNLNEEAKAVFLVFAILPTASSAYILARQLKGDAVLMANIITLQTLVAIITMPLMLILLA